MALPTAAMGDLALSPFLCRTLLSNQPTRPRTARQYDQLPSSTSLSTANSHRALFGSPRSSCLLIELLEDLSTPTVAIDHCRPLDAAQYALRSLKGRKSNMAPSAPMSFAAALEKKQEDKTLRVVQLDGSVVLKIVKHCQESQPALVTGQLLGLDIGSTLEVTDCFPFPVWIVRHTGHLNTI